MGYRAPLRDDPTPLFAVMALHRGKRLTLQRNISSLARALACATDLRQHRFHAPENVIIVDQRSGRRVPDGDAANDAAPTSAGSADPMPVSAPHCAPTPAAARRAASAQLEPSLAAPPAGAPSAAPRRVTAIEALHRAVNTGLSMRSRLAPVFQSAPPPRPAFVDQRARELEAQTQRLWRESGQALDVVRQSVRRVGHGPRNLLDPADAAETRGGEPARAINPARRD
jgi:hypothetical protein